MAVYSCKKRNKVLKRIKLKLLQHVMLFNKCSSPKSQQQNGKGILQERRPIIFFPSLKKLYTDINPWINDCKIQFAIEKFPALSMKKRTTKQVKV